MIQMVVELIQYSPLLKTCLFGSNTEVPIVEVLGQTTEHVCNSKVSFIVPIVGCRIIDGGEPSFAIDTVIATVKIPVKERRLDFLDREWKQLGQAFDDFFLPSLALPNR